MQNDLGASSGSREPSPSSTGLGPSGFDPARIERRLDAILALTVLTYAAASYRPRRRSLADRLWDLI
jgi:hypothetical protein